MTPNSSLNAQSQTISRKLARKRVLNWLNTVGSLPMFKKKPKDIPRAIFIPLLDLKQMLSKYPEQEVKGVRIYFGLTKADDPDQPLEEHALRGLLVPVLYTDEKHSDLITQGENPNDTSIYDFTAPCPVYCDEHSELYIDYPQV